MRSDSLRCQRLSHVVGISDLPFVHGEKVGKKVHGRQFDVRFKIAEALTKTLSRVLPSELFRRHPAKQYVYPGALPLGY